MVTTRCACLASCRLAVSASISRFSASPDRWVVSVSCCGVPASGEEDCHCRWCGEVIVEFGGLWGSLWQGRGGFGGDGVQGCGGGPEASKQGLH